MKLKLHGGHGVEKVKKPLDRSYGFLHDSAGKESASNAKDTGDVSLILGSERSPGGENGNPLQYSCLKKFHGQRRLVGYSPKGRKESDMTE